MTTLRLPLRRIIVTLAFGLATSTAANAATLSMAEFLAMQPRWAELAESGETLRVEGRVASSGRRMIRMRNCPLDFRPDGKEFTAFDPDALAVEVVGRLHRRADVFVFIVTELRKPPSDAETFALKAASLDVDDPADWYELAGWAAQRGTFYTDGFLLTKASEARRTALALERRAAAGDAEALAELAARAKAFGLAEIERSLNHESLRAAWKERQGDSKSDLDPLLKQLEAHLPGAGKPLEKWPDKTADAYAADPVNRYDAADDKQRPVLERIFYAEVKQAAIERLAVPSGANGELIADRLGEALPERPELARRHRELELKYRRDRITTSTRAEALMLADRLRARDRGNEATAVLKEWLAAREDSARKDGPAELARVAEDYADLLGDKATAARLLVELIAKSPESESLADQLRRLDYVERDGKWMTKAEAAKHPLDPVVQAMREGRVAVNMSPEQVRKTLGKPDTVARSASSAQVHEVWIYGQSGHGGLAVHFHRYSGGRSQAVAAVVAVSGLTP